MKKEQVLEMFKEFPDDNEFEFLGSCHDCKKETSVVIFRSPESENGFEVEGGSVYAPEGCHEKFVKCEACFEKNRTLRNFRECEVFSRVVGYLRPTKNYNPGKAAEFKDRKNFRMPV